MPTEISQVCDICLTPSSWFGSGADRAPSSSPSGLCPQCEDESVIARHLELPDLVADALGSYGAEGLHALALLALELLDACGSMGRVRRVGRRAFELDRATSELVED